jgi:RNA polymerase sigma-70 factor (ECF subfamily)
MSRGPTRFADEALSHADALYNLARYLTGSRADAEDLVQDTYARAFGAEKRFEPGTNAKAWLFRILRNAFIDRRRRAKNDPIQGGLDTISPDPELEPTEEGEWLRGDRELERLRSVVAAELESALLALPEASRAVILLDLEGFTELEVAAVLGCAAGTVKSRLARARMALRQRLGEYQR